MTGTARFITDDYSLKGRVEEIKTLYVTLKKRADGVYETDKMFLKECTQIEQFMEDLHGTSAMRLL